MWTHHVKREVDRGLVGAWARRSRLDAGYTSAEQAAAKANAAGIEIKTTYLRGIESGAHRNVGRELIVQLAALYGVSPPEEAEEGDRWLAEIRAAVAEGVEIGLVRAFAQMSEAPQPRRHRQSH
jgi:hypothetical protein